jgi:hypothetical protein
VINVLSRFYWSFGRKTLETGVVFSDDGAVVFGIQSGSSGQNRIRKRVPYSEITKCKFSFAKGQECFRGIGVFYFFFIHFDGDSFCVPINGMLDGFVPFAGPLESNRLKNALDCADKLIHIAIEFVKPR